MKRFVFGVLGGVIVTVLLLAAVAPLAMQLPVVQNLREEEASAVEVRSVEAVSGSLVRTINAPGEIEPERNVEISAQVSARVVELPFDEGDRVREGEVVVRLDDRDLRAALDAAEAQMLADKARLLGAEADQTEALSDVNRQRQLFETNDASQASVEAAEARLLRAESAVAQIGHAIAISEARIRQAERNLDNTVIRSPIDGVVTDLQAEVGELVVVGTLNNPGSVIMRIADLSRMLVKARIDESNIALVREGQPAVVYLNAYPDAAFDGSVTFVGLTRQIWRDGSGYVEADVLIEGDAATRLQTGLTSNVDIEVSTLENVVKVPSQAVVDRRVEALPTEVVDASPEVDQSRTFTRVVYVIGESGKAEVRPVEIGTSDLSETVIVSGIDQGERVIAGPFSVLSELEHDLAVREEGETEASAEPDEATDATVVSGESAGGGA